jgi:predicted dinucleotide-utilizing enzyme
MKMECGNSVERKVSHSFPKSRRCLGVGLIGCGTIGIALARAIDEGKAGDTELVCIYDLDVSKCEKLAEVLSLSHMLLKHFLKLLNVKM